MKEKRLNPDEIIFNKDEIVDSLYILMKGEINLFLPIKNGNAQYTVLQTLHKGDVIGEISFFSEHLAQWGAIT
jgi:CRP-like cAMP-binding protein